ncbi:MAG: hypothetical protein P8X57_08045, partial [Cyclobacteriaceae bacterium]
MKCADQGINGNEARVYARVIGLQQIDDSDLSGVSDEFAAYLKCYNAFLDAQVTGAPASFEYFEEQSEKALKEIPEDSDPLNLYLRAEINIQRSFVKLKQGSELSAVWLMRQAYRDVSDYAGQYPDNINFKKTWGLLQILVGAIPDNYQWIPKIFGVEGSIDMGRSLLLSIPEEHWLYSESQAIAALADSYLLEESSRAVRSFRKLISKNGENRIFSYLY